jgi:hypothetical protein
MRILDIITETKQPKDAPKPRNFVAKNAINTGAGQHKDKKRAEKQGDVKHKKQAVPMDEQGVAEATGDEKFDKMLKGVTSKKAVAKQQKTDTKQQARDAFGSMFGGGNPADKLSIRKKGVSETATAGATSAGNVAVGPVYKNKPAKQAKNKDGTAKNALDMKANLMTGGSIKR